MIEVELMDELISSGYQYGTLASSCLTVLSSKTFEDTIPEVYDRAGRRIPYRAEEERKSSSATDMASFFQVL